MLRSHLSEFLEQFSYPEGARAALFEAFEKLNNDEETYEAFIELLKRYEEDIKCDFKSVRICMKEISSKAGVHEYTGNIILFICLSKTLKSYYLEAGLDEKMWFAAMCDLKWKIVECKEIYNIWGNFSPEWYDRFFNMERFCFGKLQFELNTFGKVYEKNGICLKPDSPVLNVHIPRTGTKLDRESMLSAYKQASEFFKSAFGGTGSICLQIMAFVST